MNGLEQLPAPATRSIHLPAAAASRSRSTPIPNAPAGARPTAGIVVVWQDTLTAMAAYAGPILGCALLGHAVVGAVLKFAPAGTDTLALAVVGVVVQTMALAALAVIALRESACPKDIDSGKMQDVVEFRPCSRLRRGAWLLVGACLHTSLILACALISAVVLVRLGLGMQELEPVYPNPDGLPRLVAQRSLDALWLDPVLAETHVTGWTRVAVFRLGESPAYPTKLLVFMASQLNTPITLEPIRLLGQASTGANVLMWLALWLAAEVGLRFRVVTAMSPDGPDLLAGVRVALRHLPTVAAHIAVIRVAAWVVQVTCLIAPVALMDNVVLPHLSMLWNTPWLVTACRAASDVASMLVGSTIAAFCAMYDARLWRALCRVSE